jgi:hypothetical protein
MYNNLHQYCTKQANKSSTRMYHVIYLMVSHQSNMFFIFVTLAYLFFHLHNI